VAQFRVVLIAFAAPGVSSLSVTVVRMQASWHF
jgi:hypothetical protein